MCDDLTCSSDEDDALAEQTWKKTTSLMNKAGYREGLDAGKEEVLQEGFNKAFSISSQLLFKVAELRGRISSKLSCSLMQVRHLEKKQEMKLQAMLLEVVNLESELLQYSTVNFPYWLKDTDDADTSTSSDVVSSKEFDCVQSPHFTSTCDKADSGHMDTSPSSSVLSCEKSDCVQNPHLTLTCDKAEDRDTLEQDGKWFQTVENRSEVKIVGDTGQDGKYRDIHDVFVTNNTVEKGGTTVHRARTVQSKLNALSEKFLSIVTS